MNKQLFDKNSSTFSPLVDLESIINHETLVTNFNNLTNDIKTAIKNKDEYDDNSKYLRRNISYIMDIVYQEKSIEKIEGNVFDTIAEDETRVIYSDNEREKIKNDNYGMLKEYQSDCFEIYADSYQSWYKISNNTKDKIQQFNDIYKKMNWGYYTSTVQKQLNKIKEIEKNNNSINDIIDMQQKLISSLFTYYMNPTSVGLYGSFEYDFKNYEKLLLNKLSHDLCSFSCGINKILYNIFAGEKRDAFGENLTYSYNYLDNTISNKSDNIINISIVPSVRLTDYPDYFSNLAGRGYYYYKTNRGYTGSDGKSYYVDLNLCGEDTWSNNYNPKYNICIPTSKVYDESNLTSTEAGLIDAQLISGQEKDKLKYSNAYIDWIRRRFVSKDEAYQDVNTKCIYKPYVYFTLGFFTSDISNNYPQCYENSGEQEPKYHHYPRAYTMFEDNLRRSYINIIQKTYITKWEKQGGLRSGS